MRPVVYILFLFLANSLYGQNSINEKSVDKFVDSLITKGIDSVLTIKVGTEGALSYDSEKTWSVYVLWPEKNHYLVKKWSRTKEFNAEQVFVGHLYNYFRLNSYKLASEKFKTCALSDHYRFTEVGWRVRNESYAYKKYSYQFSDSCPEETEYNNKLLLMRMFKLVESEISYINERVSWKPL